MKRLFNLRNMLYLALGLTIIISSFPTINNDVADATNTWETKLEQFNGTTALPVGYERYEYLESDGKCLIPLGFYHDNADSYDFQIKFMCTTLPNTYSFVFGSCGNDDSLSNNVRIGIDNRTSSTRLGIGYNFTTTKGLGNYVCTFADNSVYDCLVRSNSCTINGSKFMYTDLPKGTENIGEYYLFGYSSSHSLFTGRIYELKVWQNGNLAYYFLPCKYNSTAFGFYDILNDTFVTNSKSGVLTGEILNHQHSSTDLSSLPNEYQPLDYLNIKKGTSKLNTGVYSQNKHLNFDITFQIPEYKTLSKDLYQCIFSASKSTSYNSMRLVLQESTDNFIISYDTTPASGRVNVGSLTSKSKISNEITNIKFGNLFGFVCNDEVVTTPENFNNEVALSKHAGTPYNSTIGINTASSGTTSPNFRLFRFKIYDDETLIRDYLPVYSVFNGKYGVFELASQKFIVVQDSSGSPFCSHCERIAKNEVNFCTSSGEVITPSNGVLFLPSDTDFSQMNGFSFDDGDVLYNADKSKSIVVDGTSIDLTLLFGDMESGIEYWLIYKDSYDLFRGIGLIKSSGLASVFLNLNGDLDSINSLSLGKNKSIAFNGNLVISNANGTIRKNAEITKFCGRGNYTWQASGDKKPYNVNIKTKDDLVGCGVSSKKWSLINHCTGIESTDQNGYWTGAHGYVANSLFNSMNPEVPLAFEYVDLYVNGDYRGNYFLTERVSADRFDIEKYNYKSEGKGLQATVVQSDGVGVDTTGDDVADSTSGNLYGGHSSLGGSGDLPLPIQGISGNGTIYRNTNSDQDSADMAISSGIQAYSYNIDCVIEENGFGGVILEFSRSYYADYLNNPNFFITKRGQYFTIKEPDLITKEQVQRTAVFIQEFEDALYSDSGFNSQGKHYSEYLDIGSFVKQFIIHTFIGDGDFLSSSTFIYIDVNPSTGELKGKFEGGVAWDLNNELKQTYLINKQPTYYKYRVNQYAEYFITKGDFVNLMYDLTKEGTAFYTNINQIVNGGLDSLLDSLQSSLNMNLSRYNTSNSYTFAQMKSNLLGKFQGRKDSWYNSFFNSESNLLGLTISNNSGVLTANVTANSDNDGIRWYEVSSDGTMNLIDEVVSSTFTPNHDGTYIAATTGGNMAYNAKITFTDPVLGKDIVHQDDITMTSNPIKYSCGKYSSNYDSLTLALADCDDGDTLIIDEDYSDAVAYTVPSGVLVDLNGHDLTNLSGFSSFGEVIDSSKEKGIIGTANISLSDEQEYLPINDTGRSGYSFFDVTIEDSVVVVDEHKSTLKFRMTRMSDECRAALDLIGKDIAGSGIKAVVTVFWNDTNGTSEQEVTFSDSLMEYIINGRDLEDPAHTYKRVFDFNINNLSDTGITGPISMQCSFVAFKGKSTLAATYGSIWSTNDYGLTWEQA